MEIYQKHFRCCSASVTFTGPSELHLSRPGRRRDHVTCSTAVPEMRLVRLGHMTHSFSCLCFAGERGDGGEAGGPVPPHCFQHGDAGLQEDPGESLSVGLEPQHVQHLLACADTRWRAQTEGGPACVQTQIHSICSSAVFTSRLQFKHAYQHALTEALSSSVAPAPPRRPFRAILAF